MVKSIQLWLAAGLGSGFLPKMPGTWGSLLALLPIYFILQSKSSFLLLLTFVVVCSLINLLVADTAEQAWGEDPGQMVIDEWAGQAVAFLGIAWMNVPISFALLLIGFILFRIFDILKPLGIKKLQNLKGGWGILVDDLLAGFYAMLILQVGLWLLP